MVTTAPRPTKQKDTDAPAREYIRSLAGGVKPSTRPADFGQWEHVVSILEKKHDLYKGDKTQMNGLLTNLREFNPSLDELLAPTVDEIIAAEPPEPLFPPLVKSKLPLELSRGACPWLDEYVAFSKKWSPRGYEGYHEAVGVSLLSAVAGHRVSYAYGQLEYTSLYIALVGFTTLFKKTTTSRLYYGLLEAAGLDWILGADVTTPQKLLSNMAGKTVPSNYGAMPEEEQQREKKRLAMSGQRGWYYDEFGQHLDAMVKDSGPMTDFRGLLRVLDDGKKTYRYDTHARGNEKIENPYLSLLAAMTPEDIRPHAGKNNKFWKDGLFARFAFVCPPEDAKSSRERFPDGQPLYPASLVHPLQNWSTWLGMPEIEIESETNKNGDVTGYTMRPVAPLPERECFASADVKDAIERYADELMDIIESRCMHESLYGSYGRLHKIALRVAMLCASFENGGKIEMRHWARGQEFAESRRADLHELYRQVNVGIPGKIKTIEDDIRQKLTDLSAKGIKGMTPSKLQGSYLKSYSVEDVRKMMESLEKSHVLVMVRTPHAPKGKYFLTDDAPQEEEKEEEKKT